MAIVVVLVCLIVPIIVGFYAVRNGMRWGVPALIAGFGALMIWGIWRGQNAQGWDGLGYALVAALVAAPAILGAVLGGLFGWWRNRKALAAAGLHN